MNNFIINSIKKSLNDMAFHDIKRASNGKAKMGAFILCSCFIEYMAGFVAGKETTKNDYIKFIEKYIPGYDANKIYKDLRCKLVHNYSEGGSYLFTDAHPELHNAKSSDGRTVINLENFIEDLGKALNKLLDEIENDPIIQKSAEIRYDEIGIITIIPHQLKVINKQDI